MNKQEISTYDVLTLGPSGAGKTVLLASLFKSLSIQGDHGFFLEVEDHRMETILNNIYADIISGESWPQGTRGDVKEWIFTCCVTDKDFETHKACRFRYIDYAGGLLTTTNPNDQGGYDFNFNQKAESVDAVLAILDGFKVLKFMNDKDLETNDVLSWTQKDLRATLLPIRKCKQIPVHFIISKWDLIAGKYNLLEVRNRLLEKVPEFNNILKPRISEHGRFPVRLIPISSIGIGFAQLQADGQMKKIPGKIPDPFRVEVPLSYVLTDGLIAQTNKLKYEFEAIENRPTEIKPKYGFLDRVNQLIAIDLISQSTNSIRRFISNKLPSKYHITHPALQKIVEVAEKGFEKLEDRVQDAQQEILQITQEAAQETERLRQQQKESLQSVKDRESALNHAIDSFIVIQNRLVNEEPASDLGKAGI